MDASSDPPTFYANFVTSVLNVDELTMEFRRILVPHRRFLSKENAAGANVTSVPVGEEDVVGAEPIARVVLTFSAAKALQVYLSEVLPQFEAARSGIPKP